MRILLSTAHVSRAMADPRIAALKIYPASK